MDNLRKTSEANTNNLLNKLLYYENLNLNLESDKKNSN